MDCANTDAPDALPNGRLAARSLFVLWYADAPDRAIRPSWRPPARGGQQPAGQVRSLCARAGRRWLAGWPVAAARAISCRYS